MTSSQIYWILQIDKISRSLSLLIGILVFVSIVAFIVYAISKISGYLCDRDSEIVKCSNCTLWSRKLLIFSSITWAIFFSIATFIPDTKTAAAMYILPEIVTSKNVSTLKEDFGELYELAVEGLKDKLKTTTTIDKRPENEKNN